MMNDKFFVAFLCIGVAAAAESGTASGQTCGQSKPDHKKTCISVRLPWKPEPIYFCTDKENVKYERQCSDSTRCSQSAWNDKTLLIATPWDCCPIASRPNNCDHAMCAPRPFNRTCVTVKHEYSGGCCPTYFCEPETEGELTCNFKTLEPSCHSPPKSKQNCVGFIDEHGCCTKYQCEGEGKPGTCPSHSVSLYGGGANGNVRQSNTATVTSPRSAPSRNVHPTAAAQMSTTNTTNIKKGPRAPSPAGPRYPLRNGYFPQPQRKLQSCIGDWNCPGDMKCCGTGVYNVYSTLAKSAYSPRTRPDDSTTGKDAFVVPVMNYDANARYGYCTHPHKDKSTPKNKKDAAGGGDDAGDDDEEEDAEE